MGEVIWNMFTQQVWRQTWEVINLNKNAKCNNKTAGMRGGVQFQDHSAVPDWSISYLELLWAGLKEETWKQGAINLEAKK